jgi:hypothetical protein
LHRADVIEIAEERDVVAAQDEAHGARSGEVLEGLEQFRGASHAGGRQGVVGLISFLRKQRAGHEQGEG